MDAKTISARDPINIKSLASLSMGKIRDLKCCLQKIGCNFWPPESKIREMERMEADHVQGLGTLNTGGAIPTLFSLIIGAHVHVVKENAYVSRLAEGEYK